MLRSFLVAYGLGFQAPTAVAQVQPLVGELRSCKLYSATKKKYTHTHTHTHTHTKSKKKKRMLKHILQSKVKQYRSETGIYIKSIRGEINESKIKSFIFLSFNWSNRQQFVQNNKGNEVFSDYIPYGSVTWMTTKCRNWEYSWPLTCAGPLNTRTFINEYTVGPLYSWVSHPWVQVSTCGWLNPRIRNLKIHRAIL